MTRQAAIEARRDELLTVQEYADLVRMNPKYVYERCANGTQPGAVRLGGGWRIDLAIVLQVPACCPNCGARFGPPDPPVDHPRLPLT